MKVINKENYKVPVYSWCPDLEESAQEQIDKLAEHPVMFHHIAVMPDCHAGMGMPIGGVIACNNAVIPNAVGVDIGCGMHFVETDYKFTDKGSEKLKLKKVMGKVRERIPVGFNKHKTPQHLGDIKGPMGIKIIVDNITNATLSVGTLGGGNHFLEWQKNEDNNLCMMIHSGSRNLGYQICKHYNDIALELNRKYYSNIPDESLPFLPIGTKEANEYIACMKFALEFALENRKTMMKILVEETKKEFKGNYFEGIDVHHNYASLENHLGRNVWVHRKGAIKVSERTSGIIPGSMGTSSYIVKGLDNTNKIFSFNSASHGAGRKMSRTKASEKISLEQAEKEMKDVIFGRWTKNRKKMWDTSEAPSAYKNIDDVLENEKDLVEIVSKLKPIAVIKG
jgi:tRNA-splicing ligase RtcB (3'-phosphate/5'-hydroxy nucleic acid ligase)